MPDEIKPEAITDIVRRETESPWLASEDIVDQGDIKVTIEKVFLHRNVKFKFGRAKARANALKFAGKRSQLLLCEENRLTCIALFGSKLVADWIGKSITLYVDHNVKLSGELVDGIRIRKTLPK